MRDVDIFDVFRFGYGEADINRWKEVVSKTLEFAIKCGLKPSTVGVEPNISTVGLKPAVKSLDWKGIKDFLEKIENDFNKYKADFFYVRGQFGNYGAESYSGYTLEIAFFFKESETKKNSYTIIPSISCYDSRFDYEEKPKNDINKLLRGLEKVLELKIVGYYTGIPDKIKINKHGFII